MGAVFEPHQNSSRTPTSSAQSRYVSSPTLDDERSAPVVQVRLKHSVSLDL